MARNALDDFVNGPDKEVVGSPHLSHMMDQPEVAEISHRFNPSMLEISGLKRFELELGFNGILRRTTYDFDATLTQLTEFYQTFIIIA